MHKINSQGENSRSFLEFLSSSKVQLIFDVTVRTYGYSSGGFIGTI